MWIVYYWDADPNGISGFLNKRKFDDKEDAQAFCDEVEGSIEFKYAFQ
jgi:viroplasmin and RNaseH domain-containing protein